MEEAIPKICFTLLKGFPHLKENDKLKTESFLEAAEEIIIVIESFGNIFKPVIIDMRGNVKKLQGCYNKDVQKFIYLEHLLHADLNPDSIHSVEALLWLKRALQLIYIFFKNILNDQSTSENVKHHLQDAYDKTLKAYHNVIVRTTIRFIYRWVPKRSELLGEGSAHNENIKFLEGYLNIMETNLFRIESLLKNYS